ncbi:MULTISPECIES: 50S ribosomal protein L11 methyltransferase [Desulfovibrio]|uniref:50S ribosomal protein L11 methyltransferase n=1 Tax=Desulfovibrio TaxID=872 RepID=UPI0026EA79CF|nr:MULTISPECIES: 50S ribosomal protein L11 methyltransferase [Desulfovibrio]MCI7617520.1 50S ribosomal protein L11 methyltransferase [Desulfovibrio piger]MDY4807350.1 50S ribosomal protein L11 methyltransferase [Desulfovibrio sp.]
MKTIHRLEIVVAESDYDCATGLLALEVPFGWEEQSLPTGETRFRVHCEQKDFLERLQQLLKQTVPAAESALSELEETDWLAAWRQFFTPVCCGNHFVVLPPWLADTQDFPGRTPILIEPKSAFGTGHHATTALCLRVVSDLLEAGRLQQGQHFLDLGTGSGVLGIGCCKFGLTGEGLDIDPLAVDNAVENRALNAIAPENFTVAEGSIGAVAGKQFDLVLANILARPLTEMAADIVRACRPGGCLVLSGLLEIQADGVTAAYKAQGLPEPRRIIDGEWAALVWDFVK